MALLIVQFSDVHLAFKDDVVFSRVDKIVEAVAAEMDAGIEGCVLLNCGDSAQAGQSEQYSFAQDLFWTIQKGIVRRIGELGKQCAVELLAIPGNHDCDFSGDQTARDFLLGQPLESLTKSSVQPLILAPQEGFFAFSESLVGRDRSLLSERPFYHSVDLNFGATRLRFHLLNSAWMSKIHETIGSLRFPLESIQPPQGPQPNYSIAVIHHPLHWFNQADNMMRTLRDTLESLSDLILTGHEHEPLSYTKQVFGDSNHMYLEGGVLLDRGNREVCTFNVLRLDLEARKINVKTLRWKSQGYFQISGDPDFRELLTNRNRIDRHSRLSLDFENSLEQIDLPINHPRRERVRLSEIFVYPDLRLYKEGMSEVLKRIRSQDVVETLVGQEKALLIGSEKSGKTSLAKRLVADFHRRGKAPIMLDGSELTASLRPDGCRKLISRTVQKQYDVLTGEEFEQLPKEKKVLIIDNLEDMQVQLDYRQAIFTTLEQRFGVLLLVGDDEFCLEEIYKRGETASIFATYRRYNICEFGYSLLEVFARKWLHLSSGHVDEQVGSEDHVNHVMSQMERVLRTNAIAHHPWVLLALLQNIDTPQGPAVKNGSYGHLFEAIITFAFDSSKYKKIDIKGKYNILSEYAFELYTQNEATLSANDFARFFRFYKNKYEIDFDDIRLCEDLAKIGLLRYAGDRWAFSSKFSYCFFVAKHLAKNIHQPEIREIVSLLCKRLYHEESANIVVFLAHLTGDPIVLDEMKTTASSLFKEHPLAEFGKDVEPINALSQIDMLLGLPSTQPAENRKLEQEVRDESFARRDLRSVDGREVRPQPESEPSSDDGYSDLLSIQASKRTIQILGQVLRNNVTDITGPGKRLIVHEIYRLARRLLGKLYQDFFQDLPAWRDELVGRYRGQIDGAYGQTPQKAYKQRHVTETEAIEKAHSHMFELYWLATLGVIMVVSEAVGMDLLAETFKGVIGEDSSLPNRLFDLSIKLERPAALPKKEALDLYSEVKDNRLILLTLRSMVVNHLYLYDVDLKDKQAICAEMKISLPQQGGSPRGKLLSPKARKRPQGRRREKGN